MKWLNHPHQKKRSKVENKVSYTGLEVVHVLEYYEENISERSLPLIVSELTKEKAFHDLKVNTVKTWK